MLGRLARWLRIMGFDVEYAASSLSDTEIIGKCKSHDLFLLTRDKELHSRYLPSMYITSQDHREQITQFLSTFTVDKNLVFTRCTECNHPLENRDTADLKGNIPEGVRERFSTVLYCPKCGKFYWEGDHYDKIVEFLRGLGIEI
jgi:uncharacterized protein with PIN domain